MVLFELEEAVTEIALDKQSGATMLASKTVDIYMRYFEHASVSDKAVFLSELLKLGNLLLNAQPSMASISNVVDLVSSQVNKNNETSLPKLKTCLMEYLTKLKIQITNAKIQIAQNALAYIPENAVIITLSESSTVEEVIRQAHLAGKISRVIISESRPLLEGLNLADKLLKFGVSVTVIVDAALGFFCREADIAIVGADTVQSDGSVVHKLGTYPLALACHDLNKSFYVTCDTLKFSKTGSYEKPVAIEAKPSNEVLRKAKFSGVDVKNIYFDITPAKYITRIITETSTFSTSMISNDFRSEV